MENLKQSYFVLLVLLGVIWMNAVVADETPKGIDKTAWDTFNAMCESTFQMYKVKQKIRYQERIEKASGTINVTSKRELGSQLVYYEDEYKKNFGILKINPAWVKSLDGYECGWLMDLPKEEQKRIEKEGF